MMTVALIVAMYYGGFWIICMIGILGMSMEMVLKR